MANNFKCIEFWEKKPLMNLNPFKTFSLCAPFEKNIVWIWIDLLGSNSQKNCNIIWQLFDFVMSFDHL